MESDHQATVIDGKAIAQTIRSEIGEEVSHISVKFDKDTGASNSNTIPNQFGDPSSVSVEGAVLDASQYAFLRKHLPEETESGGLEEDAESLPPTGLEEKSRDVILDSMDHDHYEYGDDEDEEYVLLDLDAVSRSFDIPPGAPYVLSGLDTPEPILIIDEKWKLIGKYEETIGTCLVFSEDEAPPVVNQETGPSEANLFASRCIIDPNQSSTKQVKPVAQLQRILKFQIVDDDVKDTTIAPTD